MRYFLDTEFIERGPKHPLELISLGMVAEDGRELYRVSTDFKPRHASQWVRENVLPHLPERNPTPPPWGSPRIYMESHAWCSNAQIAADILSFIGGDMEPEFWGYYCDYDWVIVCQLFGDMSAKPSHFPYYCRDLKQLIDDLDGLHIRQSDDAQHNALTDARWIRDTYREIAADLAGARL